MDSTELRIDDVPVPEGVLVDQREPGSFALLIETRDALMRSILAGTDPSETKARRLWKLGQTVPALIGGFSGEDVARLGAQLRRQAAQLIEDNLLAVDALAARDRRAQAFAQSFELRPWQQSDSARYAALLDDPAMWAQLPEDYPQPFTQELAASLLEIVNAQPTQYVRAMTLDGNPIGQLRLEFTDPSDRTQGEISYWIGREYWGHGHASKLVTHGTLHIFQQFPELDYVFARVLATNPASASVLDKAGYREEGLVRATSGLWAQKSARRFGIYRVSSEALLPLAGAELEQQQTA